MLADTPADDITAILRNIVAAGLDEITVDRLLKILAAQTNDSIVAMRKRFTAEKKAYTARHVRIRGSSGKTGRRVQRDIRRRQ